MATATSFDEESLLSISPAPAPHPFRFARVLRLLRSLNRDAEQTLDALEMFDAVGGSSGERVFQRFLADPRGARMLRDKPRIEVALADREALAALPEATLGRAYLDFALKNGFSADGLAALGREVEREEGAVDPHRQWFWDRYSVTHDLYHVLSSCDTSKDGEVVLLAFSQAQTPQRGYAALLGLAVVMTNIDWRRQRKLWRAWRAGKAAEPLLFAPWEELLARPLAEVRAELRVAVLEQ